MKTLLINLFSLIIINLQAQNLITINTSPGSWEDGFSWGVGFEKQQDDGLFYGAEAYWFPDLRGYDYGHLQGRFGVAVKLDRWGEIKLLGNVRGGLVYRGDRFNYASMGVEGGVQWQLPAFINKQGRKYLIITGSIDEATDSKFYSNQDSITRKSVWVKLGIKLN